ncbi:MAG: prolipoprotein diacylglyceryl transferase [Chitinivibrionia bacterium]|nr:prolipoprotein diacylglyceryl transferase [Chitinivibrionia bacterium]
MDFIAFWQTLPLHLDPTFITIFGEKMLQRGTDLSGAGFAIRYYGLMYIIGFMVNIALLKKMCRKQEVAVFESEMENLCIWIIAGIMLGGRLGYVLFYNLTYYSQNLGEIFLPFAGGKFVGISGMSFHGAVIGGTLLGTIYVLIKKLDWKECANAVFFVAPLGYTFGRFGNFMNGELYGRQTSSAIGMYFKDDPTVLRFPSQLFEMLGEGILLFAILCAFRKFSLTKNLMTPLYLIGYGIIRFFIEFYREPDAHIMLNSLGFSRGQMLCSAMIILGIAMIPFFVAKFAKKEV